MAHRQYVVNLKRAAAADYLGDIDDMVDDGIMTPLVTMQETDRYLTTCGDTHPDEDVYHPDGHVQIRTRWVTKWEVQDA